MKVFISWSGDTSHKYAVTLYKWLPCVINSLTPYVSSEDISKGARWSAELAKELQNCHYGIICLTKENVAEPWLNFEAGALSKALDKASLMPILFELKISDVRGPLSQFNLRSLRRKISSN